MNGRKHLTINPDDFLMVDGQRLWTPERNAAAWATAYEAAHRALERVGVTACLVVVCGVQGSGKTTWIAAQPPSDETVYFDAALPCARHRAAVVAVAQRSGAAVEAVWVRTSLEEAIRRNARRPADEVVPLAAIQAVAAQFEEPTLEEGFVRVRVIDAYGGLPGSQAD